MGWLEPLAGGKVAIDSAPLIYFIEEHPRYLPALIPFFELVDAGNLTCIASVVAITEVLVHPLRQGRADLAAMYREILVDSQTIITYPINADIAERAAVIRAAHNVRTPDAFHLATAIGAEASIFLTNDMAVPTIPGISIILLDDVLLST